MKRIGTYRRSAGFIMVVVMSAHLFSGLGIFCTNAAFRPLRALGIDLVAFGITASDHSREMVSGSGRDNPEGQGGTSNCCCKKQKQCPAIPRAVITSNATQRFSELQRQLKAVCFHPLVASVMDHRVVTGSGPPLMELVWSTAFYSSTPLALTCVLLI